MLMPMRRGVRVDRHAAYGIVHALQLDDAERRRLSLSIKRVEEEDEVQPLLVLEGVPIDVLAERLDSNRNALYKVLHDARRRLREHVAAAGFPEANQ